MTSRIGQQFGNYTLTNALGEGGFAEVYLGEHIHLGTTAAIKILHTQLSSENIDDFRTEARTIARLSHPHIVRVLDFGIENKTPFLVMDYAPNGTLRQRHRKGEKLPLPVLVSYVKQVADALQYAHDEKLIHRDIKPENMLIGRRSEILLSDFGIALVAQSSRYQSTQELAGTMAYMPPEQIQGKPRPASDQYALGVVVYEWLTGDRPFHGSAIEIISQHLAVPPPSIREKVPDIPWNVEEVVMVALAKDPHQRFASVQAFALALEQAFQEEQAPTYVRPSPAHILSRPPTVEASVIPTQTSQNFVPKRGTLLATYKGHNRPVLDVSWSPNARYLASGGKDKKVCVWDVNSGKTLMSYHNQADSINTVVWSSKEEQIASVSDDGMIQIWKAFDGSLVGFYHVDGVRCVAWSPDATRLVSASSRDYKVYIWHLISRQNILRFKGIGTFKGYGSGVNAVAWSPDGKYIATVTREYRIHIWDADASTGSAVSTQATDSSRNQKYAVQAHLLAWSPDGSQIALVSPEQTVHIWDKMLNVPLGTYTHHTAEVYSVAWSPDGTRIASSSADNTVCVWDATTGQTLFIYRGHTDSVYSAVWSPDSACIDSASADGTVQVWRA